MPEFTGTRCHICTGCGRCAGRTEGIRVVTDSFVMPEMPEERLRQHIGEFAVADIGTTTIAMEHYSAEGKKLGQYVQTNPQRIFGADVISRIQAAESPMRARQLQTQVRQALAEGLRSFMGQTSGKITDLIVAANTTMNYLLLGYDPAELGTAPFHASHLESGQSMIEGIPVRTLPGSSAFVGGDITAGILACQMADKEEISLLIDLGTNGEMVLGNRERLMACSTAAGPAFEGSGSREKGNLQIWGADMVKLTARLLEQGILDETGLLQEPYFDAGIDIGGVHITQEGIRGLQTAKAAIAAGIQCLNRAYGLADMRDIKRVYLAGGFGYFLDSEAAVKIGLLPENLQGRIRAAGNTALAGAYVYHRLSGAPGKAESICRRIETRNLAKEPDFSERFIGQMYLRSF